jgi:dTDP-4-amino-4,6-dideoxygalactose transaminase
VSKLAIDGGTPVWNKGWPKWPVTDEREVAAITRIVREGNWWHYCLGQAWQEVGEKLPEHWGQVARFQRTFARYHGCQYGVACTSGTTAIEIALRALGVGPGDEVIVPAYTFIATATAPALLGARPVFVDIKPATGNMDPDRLWEMVTGRTKAIVPVHLGGQPADMDAINAVAKRHGLAVLEDAAQAHGASYQGRMAGSLADAGAFSFQVSKNVSGGEGGAITTNRRDVAEICDSLVWVGRRMGDAWYTHQRLAGNSRMTEFQGAILNVQLSRLAEHMKARASNAALLDELLGRIEGLRPLTPDPNTTAHAYHLYMFWYHPGAFGGWPKERFIEAVNAEGVPIMGGYATPLYRQPAFAGVVPDVEDAAARCPVSEEACRSLAWIFQSVLLAQDEAIRAIPEAIAKVQKAAQRG